MNMVSTTPRPLVDFENTEYAFAMKSDRELKKSAWLFKMMQNTALVQVGSSLALLALKLRLPVQWAIKRTIFEQFCGGTTLLECVPTIQKMADYGVTTMLDYGTEGKQTEEEFNKTMRATNNSIRFGQRNAAVHVVTVKISGLMEFRLLEKKQAGEPLTEAEQHAYESGIKRVDSICHVARENHVQVYFDAEETWVQDSIDEIVMDMIERYNTEQAIVFNTIQLYRHDRLAYLKASHQRTLASGVILGVKLVRGAYLDKERERAKRLGYTDPMQPDKASTDRDYDAAIDYCAEHYQTISFCAATHNAASSLRLVNTMSQLDIPRNHPHFVFCQLYGMSDNLTFNLSRAGFTASKYVVYGAVKEAVPYLIRRAQENSAVTGDVSRELNLLQREIQRRGI